MSTSRVRNPALAGLVAGVVLLVAMVAFVVLLPKIGDDGVTLPETLPGGFTSLDVPDESADPAQGDPVAAAEQRAKVVASAAENLAEANDTTAEVKAYAGPQGVQTLFITHVDAAPGPFAPDGPPVDPTTVADERLAAGYDEVDGAICSSRYNQQVAPGTPVEGETPIQVYCQLDDPDQTWTIFATAMTAADAVEVLHGVADDA